MGTVSRMGVASLLLVVLLCTVVQQSPLAPAGNRPPKRGVYVVIGPLNPKSLRSAPSRAEPEVAGDDYFLSFGGDVANASMVLGDGDVAFNKTVTNIQVDVAAEAELKFRGEVDNVDLKMGKGANVTFEDNVTDIRVDYDG